MNHLFTPIVESMNSSQTALSRNLSADMSSGLEYHELGHELGMRHPVESNVLEELKNNLEELSDLHFRLKYMMGEIGQHTRRKA